MKSRLLIVICIMSLLSLLTPTTFAQTPDPYPETIVCDHSPCEVINADRLAGMRQDAILQQNTFLISPNNTPNIISRGYTQPKYTYSDHNKRNSFLTPQTIIIPKEADILIPQMGVSWNSDGLSYSPSHRLDDECFPNISVPGYSNITIPDQTISTNPYFETGATLDNIIFIWQIQAESTPNIIKLIVQDLSWHILQPSFLPPVPYSIEISPYPNDWQIGEIVTLNRIYPEVQYHHIDGSDWKIAYITTKAIEIIRKGDPITIRSGQFFFAKPCPGYERCYFLNPEPLLLGTDFEIVSFGPLDGIVLKSLDPPPWVDDASKG